MICIGKIMFVTNSLVALSIGNGLYFCRTLYNATLPSIQSHTREFGHATCLAIRRSAGPRVSSSLLSSSISLAVISPPPYEPACPQAGAHRNHCEVPSNFPK
jgi:hypothetical protein